MGMDEVMVCTVYTFESSAVIACSTCADSCHVVYDDSISVLCFEEWDHGQDRKTTII